jgi:hypothetical protein
MTNSLEMTALNFTEIILLGTSGADFILNSVINRKYS